VQLNGIKEEVVYMDIWYLAIAYCKFVVAGVELKEDYFRTMAVSRADSKCIAAFCMPSSKLRQDEVARP